MIESHPQAELLIKYADQQASQAEQQQVLDLIQKDEAAATLLNRLQSTMVDGSGLSHALPEADPAMVEMINDWQPESQVTEKRTFGLPAIAATLVAGLTTGYLLTSIIKSPINTDNTAAQIAETETPEWIRLVADYHRLYARQTIEDANTPSTDLASAEVTRWLDRKTSIPLLDDQGITFKRAQQLTVNDDVLVQLAYLPEQTSPVAVCIRKTRSSKNTDVTFANYGGMPYAEWQTGNYAIVIVGELEEQTLKSITERVRNTLFNKV